MVEWIPLHPRATGPGGEPPGASRSTRPRRPMSDPKPYYELLLSSGTESEEFPGVTTIVYQCPIPRCGYEVSHRAHHSDLKLGTVVRLGPERPEQVNLASVYDDMLDHLDHFTSAGHRTQDWLLALQDQEDAHEEAAGAQNRENERAWHAARS